jgi:exopolyphosphatase/pppGpp-phosphohydrolase
MSNLTSNTLSHLISNFPLQDNTSSQTTAQSFKTLVKSYTSTLVVGSYSALPQPVINPLGTFTNLLELSRPPAPTITEPQKTNHLQAIIKIGSNTGSITITDLVNKYYIESDKFNLGEGLSKEKDEKKFNLGEDLSEQKDKKKLKKDNIDYSLNTMERWAQIMKLYGITECKIVATESLRAASDGQEYLNQAIKILNDANPSIKIENRIIEAQEEAKLSIETVKSQLGPKIENGYVVDYGGASCEISEVTGNELATDDNGKGVFSSLKIGAHPLIAELKKLNNQEELWGKDLADLITPLKEKITKELNTLNFIDKEDREENSKAAKENKNKKNKSQENRETLYLIGGSLRKAGESIMEKGETLNDINLNRKTILKRLEERQNSL